MHRESSDRRQLVRADRDAFTVAFKFEDDLFAAKDEQIRVFRDDPVDVAFSLEKAKLGVGFIRRNDIVDILRSKRLSSISRMPTLANFELSQTHLDELKSHLGCNVDTFRIGITGVTPPALTLERFRPGQVVGP